MILGHEWEHDGNGDSICQQCGELCRHPECELRRRIDVDDEANVFTRVYCRKCGALVRTEQHQRGSDASMLFPVVLTELVYTEIDETRFGAILCDDQGHPVFPVPCLCMINTEWQVRGRGLWDAPSRSITVERLGFHDIWEDDWDIVDPATPQFFEDVSGNGLEYQAVLKVIKPIGDPEPEGHYEYLSQFQPDSSRPDIVPLYLDFHQPTELAPNTLIKLRGELRCSLADSP